MKNEVMNAVLTLIALWLAMGGVIGLLGLDIDASLSYPMVLLVVAFLLWERIEK